jgi:hypothetical protein
MILAQIEHALANQMASDLHFMPPSGFVSNGHSHRTSYAWAALLGWAVVQSKISVRPGGHGAIHIHYY